MTNTKKIILFSILVLAVLLILPNISNASTEIPVTDEADLVEAIKTDGAVITLQNDITLDTTALEVYTNVTINGNGHSIIGKSTMVGVSSPNNKSIVTAMPGAEITLSNVIIENAIKYGVQAYTGGTVTLNGVTINNCGFGGVLINGGTVIVNELSLGLNGTGANNGIEMDKGTGVSESPTLIMDGRLSTTQKENVVRILSDSNITNSNDTVNKIFVSDNSVILADANNNVIAEGAVEGGAVNEEVQKVILTIVTSNAKKEIVIDKNATITKDMIESYINLADNEVIDGCYTDNTYSIEFNFDTTVDADTTIYVKVSTVVNNEEEQPSTTPTEQEQPTVEEGEKDETPKTGVVSCLGIATGIIVLSTIAIIVLKRKNA